MKRNNKKAFTLTEVLIMLVLIGVVMVIAIKAITVRVEQLIAEARLSSTVVALQQALDEGTRRNGKMKAQDFQQGTEYDIFDRYFAPYLKVEKKCTSSKGRDCGYEQGRFWKRRDKNYEQEYIQRSGNGTPMHRTMAKLKNNVVILFNPWACDPTGCWDAREIIIDIDGPKGKNVYGRDVFILTIDPNTNKIMAKNSNATLHSVKYKCNTTGQWCAALIQKSGWKIPEGYNW